MQYINQKCGSIYLIKYDNQYSECIKNLEQLNSLFMSYIKKWPSYMDENSKMQSYMIMNKEIVCYGGIFMYPTTSKSNTMIVNILLDDLNLKEEQSFEIIDELINCLSTKLPDKDNFNINLYSKLNLSDFNGNDYQKLYETVNHQSFNYENDISKENLNNSKKLVK